MPINHTWCVCTGIPGGLNNTAAINSNGPVRLKDSSLHNREVME